MSYGEFTETRKLETVIRRILDFQGVTPERSWVPVDTDQGIEYMSREYAWDDLCFMHGSTRITLKNAPSVHRLHEWYILGIGDRVVYNSDASLKLSMSDCERLSEYWTVFQAHMDKNRRDHGDWLR